MSLYGLVLSGGQSTRMGQDKGALVYSEFSSLDQRSRCFEQMRFHCDQVFVSCLPEQVARLQPGLPYILDSGAGVGPGLGILSAAMAHPQASWLVLACDFPFAREETIQYLIEHRDPSRAATCFVHPDGVLEPLFAIWERPALMALERAFSAGRFSPRAVLETENPARVSYPAAQELLNVNRPGDLPSSF